MASATQSPHSAIFLWSKSIIWHGFHDTRKKVNPTILRYTAGQIWTACHLDSVWLSMLVLGIVKVHTEICGLVLRFYIHLRVRVHRLTLDLQLTFLLLFAVLPFFFILDILCLKACLSIAWLPLYAHELYTKYEVSHEKHYETVSLDGSVVSSTL